MGLHDDTVAHVLRTLDGWADTYRIAEHAEPMGLTLTAVRQSICSLQRRKLVQTRLTGRTDVKTEYRLTDATDDKQTILEAMGEQTLRSNEVATITGLGVRRVMIELRLLEQQGKVKHYELRDPISRHLVLWWRRT